MALEAVFARECLPAQRHGADVARRLVLLRLEVARQIVLAPRVEVDTQLALVLLNLSLADGPVASLPLLSWTAGNRALPWRDVRVRAFALWRDWVFLLLRVWALFPRREEGDDAERVPSACGVL